MQSNDRRSFTVYPLWLVWLGRVLLYLALLMLPALLAAWLAEQASALWRSAVQIAANLVLLPLLYAGLYWLLRLYGARPRISSGWWSPSSGSSPGASIASP
jgi:hypothetical protein